MGDEPMTTSRAPQRAGRRAGAAERGSASRRCDACGEPYTPGDQFCPACRAFVGWDPDGPAAPVPTGPQVTRTEASVETTVMPRVVQETAPPPPPDGADPQFTLVADRAELEVNATGEPTTLALQVTNTSSIVDGYTVDAPDAPAWLRVESAPLHLLPGSGQAIPVSVRVQSDVLVPAQQTRLVLRVASLSRPSAHVLVPVRLTVAVLDVPLRVSAEPRLLRVRDTETAECRVLVDNTGSNHPVRVRLGGSDPELAVRFAFDPPVLEVGPASSAVARLRLTAPAPEPGRELSRSLSVMATVGERAVESSLVLQQLTSAVVVDPPVGLEVSPSLLRVHDTTVGVARVVVDNRAGTRWVEVELRATDPERVVRAAWTASRLRVPPGGTVATDLRLEAPLPANGEQLSRQLTVTASAGTQTSTATVTFAQVASPSPMETLAVRVEPEVVRVSDVDHASVQVVLDNRRGRTGVRLALAGSDPERAVGFAFATPAVELGAGEVRAVVLGLDAWRPEPGREVTRPFTVSASARGQHQVTAAGSLVQTSSRAAIELLTLGLDPSVLRLGGRRRGRTSVLVDNRRGSTPVRVSLRGDDPENAVRFTFAPVAVEVPAGRVGRSTVSVTAPRAPGGSELNRAFSVLASDGRADVEAQGSLTQSAAPRRPLARVLFTVLGGLAMIVGALGTWDARSGARGTELTADVVASVLRAHVDLGAFDRVASVGVLVLALGVLVVFGLTGRTGRLSRFSAALGLLLVVGVFVGFTVAGMFGGRQVDAVPAAGAFLVAVGAVAGWVGGRLAPR